MTKEATEYFADGNLFFSSEPDERLIPVVMDQLGTDCVFYASDYPHTDSKFPYSVKTIRERDDLPDGAAAQAARRRTPPATTGSTEQPPCTSERAGRPLRGRRARRRRRSRRPARRHRRARHPSVAGGGRPCRRDRRPARAALDDVGGTAIAVVASGAAVGPAIDAASYDPRVVAVCTLGGPVPPTAARVFELWKDVPVLAGRRSERSRRARGGGRAPVRVDAPRQRHRGGQRPRCR